MKNQLKNCINCILNCILDNPICRFATLVVAAAAGFGAWYFSNAFIRCIFSQTKSVGDSIEIFILSSLVLISLWCFRTHDTREQIQKTQEQIQQGNFASGLNKLVEDEGFKISIGVQLLIQVSKSTDTFNKDIRLAFIKRIQKLPNISIPPLNCQYHLNMPELSYLIHIFQWLVDHDNRGYIDVPAMNFQIQEFEFTHKFDQELYPHLKIIPIEKMQKVLNDRERRKSSLDDSINDGPTLFQIPNQTPPT